MVCIRLNILLTALGLTLSLACAARQTIDLGAEEQKLLQGQLINATPTSTGAMGEGVTIGELLPIYFDYDIAQVPEREMVKIKQAVAYLQNQLVHFAIRLEGHADDRGSYDYNFALGLERAANVAALLVSLGINPFRLSVTSYGEEFPAVIGWDEVAKSQNRRVEFVIVSP